MKNKYGDHYIKKLNSVYDAIIITVGHKEFYNLNIDKLIVKNGLIFDVKSIFSIEKGYIRL